MHAALLINNEQTQKSCWCCSHTCQMQPCWCTACCRVSKDWLHKQSTKLDSTICSSSTSILIELSVFKGFKAASAQFSGPCGASCGYSCTFNLCELLPVLDSLGTVLLCLLPCVVYLNICTLSSNLKGSKTRQCARRCLVKTRKATAGIAMRFLCIQENVCMSL